jgi:Tfp pilus assembly protein PilF
VISGHAASVLQEKTVSYDLDFFMKVDRRNRLRFRRRGKWTISTVTVAVLLGSIGMSSVWLMLFRLNAVPATVIASTAHGSTPGGNGGAATPGPRTTRPPVDLNILAMSAQARTSVSARAIEPSSDHASAILPSLNEQLDPALAKANADLQADPRNLRAYIIRGNVYFHEKLWDHARNDYQAALQIDGSRIDAKFNLAEVNFVQKNYAAARPTFVAMESDPDHGDYASYKVFLCDLFGGHSDAADKELAAFNEEGTHASYYFSNVAWDLVHHQTEDARSYLDSALHIYDHENLLRYGANLLYLGYLPLPPQVGDVTPNRPSESGQSVVPGV